MSSTKREYRYLQLMPAYAPAWGFGGPVRLMYEYARWMAETASQTTVITGDVYHDYSAVEPKTDMLSGIYIRRIRVYWRRLVKNGIYFVSPRMLLVAMWRVMKFPGRTFVHVGDFRSPVFLYAVVLKYFFPRKVILIHSAFGMLHYKSSRLRKIYDCLFMGSMLRNTDLALGQNLHEMSCYHDYFSRYGAAGSRTILFPLHVKKHELAAIQMDEVMGEDRITLRRKYGVPEGAFVLIFLGRLHPAKGIIRAIEAFLQFSKEYRGSAYFLVVGRDAGMQQQITEYIKKCDAASSIRIVKDVYEERFEYYRLADLFVAFPLIYEETLLASVEALSCGTPVLVSREADIPFVEKEGAGFVIDFTVETAIQRIHQVAAQQGVFRQQALKVAEQHFSDAAARGNFIAILDKYSEGSEGQTP